MPLCCHNADVLPPDLTIHKSGHNATIFHQKWGYDVSKCNMDRKGVVASASGVLEGSGEIPPPPHNHSLFYGAVPLVMSLDSSIPTWALGCFYRLPPKQNQVKCVMTMAAAKTVPIR